jgi:hypothetical protein
MFKPGIGLCVIGLLISVGGFSQVNSPYSRFGIGDLTNSRNVVAKGMGGLATPYAEIQSVNFINPASYSSIGFVTLDVGFETEFRTLANQDRTERFESANLLVNYLALGLPLKRDKKTGSTIWGMAMGLRPLSRIRYNIETSGRVEGIDSTLTFNRGNGGLYRAFIGTGYKIGGLSLGINAGYIFGQRELSNIRSIVNDSVPFYTSSFSQRTGFSSFALDGGLQYEIKTSKSAVLRIAANGYLGGDVNAERERLSQTVFFNNLGTTDSIDVVERGTTNGTFTFPAGYTVGLAYEKANKFLVGAEYEIGKWSDLTNFGESEGLGDVRMFRAGGHFIPDATSNRNYYKQIAFRGGFFMGKDYVVINGHQLPIRGFSVGGGFPVRRYNSYSTQYNTINLAFEWGRRGNGQSPYTERFYKVSVGLALSDVWFIKRQFD